MNKETKVKLEAIAEEILMEKIALALGYWQENELVESISNEEKEMFAIILHKKADMIAKKFGYEKAWSS